MTGIPALTHRSRTATVVLLVAATIGGFLWWRSTDKPALINPANGAGIGAVMELTRSQSDITLGSMGIEFPGSQITVVEVKPRTSPNVEFLGAFTVWPRDLPGNNYTTDIGFPPRPPFDPGVRHPLGKPIPAAETAHMPGDSTEPQPVAVMAGFRISSGDLAAVNGIDIEYQVDGRTVREYFDREAIVCVDPRPCEPPKGTSETDWQDQVFRQFGLLRDES